MERPHPQRRHVRDQRQDQAAVAACAPALPRRGGDPDVARGSDAGVAAGPVVQGGVEAEAGAGEPEEDGGEAAGGDGA